MIVEPENLHRILVVDDEVTIRELFRNLLLHEGYHVDMAENCRQAAELLEKELPDLILLDVMMPEMDGVEFCKKLKASETTRHIPVVLVTAMSSVEDKLRGLEAGAEDFLSKPVNVAELRARVHSLLRLKGLHDALTRTNRLLSSEKLHLEHLVSERTRELEELTLGLVTALEKANELNDMDTGKHIRRVCSYAEVLAKAADLPADRVTKIKRYASLHDVGKVGIPDRILKKPGKLTPQEYEEMKVHARLGFELLSAARADQIALNIAFYHHEKFDGTGYPQSLQGEEIPLEARIVTLADTFDAMTTRRCYKDPLAVDIAIAEVTRLSGTQFDPRLVQLLLKNEDEFRAIMVQLADATPPEEK